MNRGWRCVQCERVSSQSFAERRLEKKVRWRGATRDPDFSPVSFFFVCLFLFFYLADLFPVQTCGRQTSGMFRGCL